MIAILVCLLQLTIIASIASATSMCFVARAPQLSARICWLGIILCAVVVAASLCEMPRMWTLRSSPTAAHAILPLTEDSEQVPRAEHSGKNHYPALGFSPSELLHQFSIIQAQHPRLEHGLVSGFRVIASVLCLAILAKCLMGVFSIWRLRAAKEIDSASSLYAELRPLVSKTGFRGNVRLCMGETLVSPCVSWIRRGTIYLPTDFEQWTVLERSAAFAHELSHEVRRDAQWRMFAELCLVCVCYHPLVCWLRRQLIFAQELATDQQAAAALGSISQYRRGLSLLALRMDSRRTAPYLVSVSTNDVVRRIKMLSVTKPTLRRWQELVVVMAVVFASGVAAAWTANADDTLRIAAKSKLSDTKSPGQLIARKTTPWEELGEQDGYLAIQPCVLVQNPLYRALYEAHVDEVFLGLPSIPEGLSANNIACAQFSLTSSLITLKDEKLIAENKGRKHQYTVGSDAMLLETKEPVAWSDIGELIPASAFGPPEAFEWFRDELAKYNNQNQVRIVSTAAESRHSDHTPQLQALWEQVNDCVVAIAMATPADLHVELDEGVDLVGARELFAAVDSTAIGLELNAQPEVQQIRLAFAPRDGQDASEVQSLVEKSRSKCVELGQAAITLGLAGEGGPEKAKQLQQLLEHLAAAPIEIVEHDNGRRLIVIRVETTANLTSLLD